jgi:hypothetical protein
MSKMKSRNVDEDSLTVKQLFTALREPIRFCGVRDRFYFLSIEINISANKIKADTHLS